MYGQKGYNPDLNTTVKNPNQRGTYDAGNDPQKAGQSKTATGSKSGARAGAKAGTGGAKAKKSNNYYGG